jgi:hypothetical protein
MEQFDRDRSCPKCGSETQAAFSYHDKGKHDGMTRMLMCPVEEEHMHRTCHDCSYEWAEQPLA